MAVAPAFNAVARKLGIASALGTVLLGYVGAFPVAALLMAVVFSRAEPAG